MLHEEQCAPFVFVGGAWLKQFRGGNISEGRICRGVELDPLYLDVIVRRYQAATGASAGGDGRDV